MSSREANMATPSLRSIDRPTETNDSTNPTPPTNLTPPTLPKPQRRKAPFVFGAIALAATAYGAHRYIAGLGKESSDDAQVEGHVSSVAARIPGEVKRVLVKDNQHVKAGDVLVELDDADYTTKLASARADLEAARANLHAAEAQRDLTRKQVAANLAVARGGVAQAAAVSGSTEALIDQAKADVASAESKAQLARVELARAQKLFDSGAVPKSELDIRRATSEQADAGVAEARARVVTAETSRTNSSGTVLAANGRLASAQTAPEQIDAAVAQVELAGARVAQAESALRTAQLDVDYTHIRAEIDGYVAKRTVEPGQIVGPDRPLLAVVGDRELWVVANLKETQLAHVRPGDKVSIRIDTFDDDELPGTVESIQSGTGARFSLLPPDNASGNFTKVTQRVPVRIELADLRGLALRPGMSADVTIITE
jgi:membrane fusion protein (multidrug efflux system)